MSFVSWKIAMLDIPPIEHVLSHINHLSEVGQAVVGDELEWQSQHELRQELYGAANTCDLRCG